MGRMMKGSGRFQSKRRPLPISYRQIVHADNAECGAIGVISIGSVSMSGFSSPSPEHLSVIPSPLCSSSAYLSVLSFTRADYSLFS
jgi:hypothetical protein